MSEYGVIHVSTEFGIKLTETMLNMLNIEDLPVISLEKAVAAPIVPENWAMRGSTRDQN